MLLGAMLRMHVLWGRLVLRSIRTALLRGPTGRGRFAVGASSSSTAVVLDLDVRTADRVLSASALLFYAMRSGRGSRVGAGTALSYYAKGVLRVGVHDCSHVDF